MADIFISYVREDRKRAKRLAHMFESLGWSVWWDPTLLPGDSFRAVIDAELKAAKAVVTLWSKKSIRSDFVRDEAEEAKQRGVLVPCLLDRVIPPMGFRQHHAADLSEWANDPDDPEFASLVRALSRYAPRPESNEPRPRGPAPRKLRMSLVVFGVILIGLLAGLGVYVVKRLRGEQEAARTSSSASGNTSSGAAVPLKDATPKPWTDAVCLLRLRQHDGSLVQSTGVLIAHNLVLTIDYALFDTKRHPRGIEVEIIPGANGNRAPYGIIKSKEFHWISVSEATRGPERGVAVIRIPRVDAPWLMLDPSPPAGSSVIAVGYRTDQPGVLYQSPRRRVLSFNDHSLQHNVETSAGMGGAPLLGTHSNRIFGLHAIRVSEVGQGVRVTDDLMGRLNEFAPDFD